MKKMTVEQTFWDLFPDGQINVLIVKGIDNRVQEEDREYFAQLLERGKVEAKEFLTEEPFSQNGVIEEWREAFRKFKTKKGARSSIEALLKRAHQDREFSPINPLVDLYNSVSLTYAVPCGGEDIRSIQGGLRLGKAEGGESFRPLGAEEDAPALPEEICYLDDAGAVCRCLNWREAQRTMLTEETTDAVLVMESINEEQAKRADEAMEELKKRVDEYFHTDSQKSVLVPSAPSCELG